MYAQQRQLGVLEEIQNIPIARIPNYKEIEFCLLWEKLFPELVLWCDRYDVIPDRRLMFHFVHGLSQVAIDVTEKPNKKDFQKLNLAQAHGWCVFQLSASMINESWCLRIADVIRMRSR